MNLKLKLNNVLFYYIIIILGIVLLFNNFSTDTIHFCKDHQTKMDETLGIDCPKNYMINKSLLMTDTPRRLSSDFNEGECF